MSSHLMIWADPRFVYPIGVAAVLLLCITIWLFRRPKRSGRQAGMICLMLSIMAHLALLLLVPMLMQRDGGSTTVDESANDEFGIDAVTFSTFDPDMVTDDVSGIDDDATVAPLPVSDFDQLLDDPAMAELAAPEMDAEPEIEEIESPPVLESLAESRNDLAEEMMSDIEAALGEVFDTPSQSDDASEALAQESLNPPEQSLAMPTPVDSRVGDLDPVVQAKPVSTATAPKAMVVADEQNDFANRVGASKDLALNRTGGNADTEAAVESALRFLADSQRPDGSWDPIASGAGRERGALGENRGGAGRRATTAITGLSLLTLLGAGHTHQSGEYSDNVFRGLSYLINHQKADGSLAGDAAVYASTYSHGMAALAMCEAAAITEDVSAMTAAKRAIAFTTRMQHPATGGWRYTPGDPGDMSQLGWQAMVLDAGHRANLKINPRSIGGVQRFMRSVRSGSAGGLACYRAGEAPSRTMTAEALATRLLIGDHVPPAEVDEAERYILRQLPGAGQDNYYYWYYATLALHQLQDDAWDTWNQALQQRLLATQRADGSWPTNSVWGGYGGSVYTTSMAALCLESYYRHTLRSDRERVASVGNPLR